MTINEWIHFKSPLAIYSHTFQTYLYWWWWWWWHLWPIDDNNQLKWWLIINVSSYFFLLSVPVCDMEREKERKNNNNNINNVLLALINWLNSILKSMLIVGGVHVFFVSTIWPAKKKQHNSMVDSCWCLHLSQFFFHDLLIRDNRIVSDLGKKTWFFLFLSFFKKKSCTTERQTDR